MPTLFSLLPESLAPGLAAGSQCAGGVWINHRKLGALHCDNLCLSACLRS
jgi:hypothetical protein